MQKLEKRRPQIQEERKFQVAGIHSKNFDTNTNRNTNTNPLEETRFNKTKRKVYKN